jgi:hypothetical protein
MKQIRQNPTSNQGITLTTYVFTSTTTNGTVTVTGPVNVSAIERGQSVMLVITGGTAQGFTTLQEYYAIPVNSTSIKLASTYQNAIIGTNITTTGNAGGGTIYPTYKVGGVVYVGTTGNVNCRGISSPNFTVLNAVPVGFVPVMIKDIHSYNTTASNLVAWSN